MAEPVCRRLAAGWRDEVGALFHGFGRPGVDWRFPEWRRRLGLPSSSAVRGELPGSRLDGLFAAHCRRMPRPGSAWRQGVPVGMMMVPGWECCSPYRRITASTTQKGGRVVRDPGTGPRRSEAMIRPPPMEPLPTPSPYLRRWLQPVTTATKWAEVLSGQAPLAVREGSIFDPGRRRRSCTTSWSRAGRRMRWIPCRVFRGHAPESIRCFDIAVSRPDGGAAPRLP